MTVGALALAAQVAPRSLIEAAAAVPGPGPAKRRLAFFNTHTRETLDELYCSGSAYVADALERIDHLLRDHRANEVRQIDRRLLDLVHRLTGELDFAGSIHVISGYRSPGTNAALRARGGSGSGVARRSLHMDGKAIDLRLPGVPLKRVREAAVDLRGGGVGYYPELDFVHVDVGRVRYW